MTTIDQFSTELTDLESQHAAKLAGIDGDRRLSPAGKADLRTMADLDHKDAVSDLQQRARAALDSERAVATKELAVSRAAASKRRRDMLGGDVLARLAREEFAELEPDAILERVTSAADDWERELALTIGDAELSRRARTSDAKAILALSKLRDIGKDADIAAAETRLVALKTFESQLSQLSPDFIAEVKQRYNLS